MDPDLIDMAFEDRISGDCCWDQSIEDRYDGPLWEHDDYWGDCDDCDD